MSTGLRLMSYLVRKLTGFVIVVLLILLTAFSAYDTANIFVVINDGMNQRTSTVLHRSDPTDLSRFFTLKYLNQDPLIQSEQYRDYLIQDYDYKLKIKRMWVWPWQDRTRVVVEEYIPEASWKFSITEEFRELLKAAQTSSLIDGEEAGEEAAEAQEVPLVVPPPQWQNGEKIVEFRKIDGQWKIDRIVFVRGMKQEAER